MITKLTKTIFTSILILFSITEVTPRQGLHRGRTNETYQFNDYPERIKRSPLKQERYAIEQLDITSRGDRVNVLSMEKNAQGNRISRTLGTSALKRFLY